jgi:hypothetical protein
MSLKARDVFTPGAFPQYTYVERIQKRLEEVLSDSLDTPGQVVSLSGPSKSGKTVLVEKVVGKDYLIPISGASIAWASDLWTRVFEWMGTPTSLASTRTFIGQVGAEIGVKAGASVPFVAKGEIGTTGKVSAEFEAGTETTMERTGLSQIVREIGNSDFVLLLDDFHYMRRDTQTEVAKLLKEAVRLGVKIVTAVVTHRGDDIMRANTELRGRVRAIDLEYWRRDELAQIVTTGFSALNATLDNASIETFVTESAGSPQLMQLLCLQTCFVMGLREAHDGLLPRVICLDEENVERVLEQTSTVTDFRSLLDVMDAGPRTRGTERKMYRFHDGSEGDVYRVVLRAVASDPPKLSFPYPELLDRTRQVCKGDSPVGSSVTGTCLHMAKLALEKFPNERTVDWDESKQVFDIPDPYFMFYLRWSGRLQSLN